MKALLDGLGVAYDFQRPYGMYLLDFALSDRRIDIEVDGEYFHEQPDHVEHDARRDNYMRRHSWKVYRFPAKTLEAPDLVKVRLLAIIAGTELERPIQAAPTIDDISC